MQVHKIPFEKTGKFPQLFIDYVNSKTELKEFYDLYPSRDNFFVKASNYSFGKDKRATLVNALNKQYQGVEINNSVSKNIDSLKNENVFTVTTGHQLSLFTGPLYFIYKIVTVIKAAQELNHQNKDQYFVPVFWMASEDHDFEEINHFFLFNKKFTWETDQKGPVGRFNTNGIEGLCDGIKEDLSFIKNPYTKSQTLSQATRALVNKLFGEFGLVVIDGDDLDLKRSFGPLIKDELLHKKTFELVNQQTALLKGIGYSEQINPREINLFYIENGLRERIVFENASYKVLNTSLVFSKEEILDLVDKHPERFSPNVALRPLYQQYILPNVAYCGGPAEIGYWLQLKKAFDQYQIDYPILLPRLSAQYIPQNIIGKVEKLGISLEDLFLDEFVLKNKLLKNLSDIEIHLDSEEEKLSTLFDQIAQKAKSVDGSLEGLVMAEKQNLLKVVKNIEKRIRKSEETKNASSFIQLSGLLDKVFPDGKLQERRDNLLNILLNDSLFLNKIILECDPFIFEFCIFEGNK